MYQESAFHSAAHAKENGPENEDIHDDIGNDTVEHVEKNMQKRIRDSENNGLTKEGPRKVEQIIKGNWSAIKVRLGNDGTAKVTPIKYT